MNFFFLQVLCFFIPSLVYILLSFLCSPSVSLSVPLVIYKLCPEAELEEVPEVAVKEEEFSPREDAEEGDVPLPDVDPDSNDSRKCLEYQRLV